MPNKTDKTIDAFVGDFIEQENFEHNVVCAYRDGSAERALPADLGVAVSWVPPSTGRLRDFSSIASDLPELDASKCVGCMECVMVCPDSAIIAKVITETRHTQLTPGSSPAPPNTMTCHARKVVKAACLCWSPIPASAKAAASV